MDNSIIPVPFQGETLVLVNHGGKPYVAMKPLVERMGLDWASQRTKLASMFGGSCGDNHHNSVAVEAIKPTVEGQKAYLELETTGGDGKRYKMVCLPLRKLPAWLYSINLNKIAPELRDKVQRYQAECDDVLWKYWTTGYAERPGRKGPTVGQQLSAHTLRLKLLDKLEAERHPEKRRAIHQQLQQASDLLSLPTPDIGAIGYEVAPSSVPAVVDAFWDAVDAIGLEKLNHARSEDRIAINLGHFSREAAQAHVKAPSGDDLRRALRLSTAPRFVDVRTVNSSLQGRSVKCWLFEPTPA